MKRSRKLIFEGIILDKSAVLWTCGVCGGGNPLSSAYCQWCGG